MQNLTENVLIGQNVIFYKEIRVNEWNATVINFIKSLYAAVCRMHSENMAEVLWRLPKFRQLNL